MRHSLRRTSIAAGLASAVVLAVAQGQAGAVSETGTAPLAPGGVSSAPVSATLKADSSSADFGQDVGSPSAVTSWPGGGSVAGSPGTGSLEDAKGVEFSPPPDVAGLHPPGAPEISTQSVLGPDNRERVFDTTGGAEGAKSAAPGIALIIMWDDAGNTYGCTGYMYGPDIVGTAGHCVHHPDIGGWIASARVYPAQNEQQSPYGYCDVTTAHSVTGWTEDQDVRVDYGALQLDCNVGNTTGWFGTYWQTGSYDGSVLAVYGYPNDKLPMYTMWGMLGPITDSYDWRLRYKIDTAGGQSGAPVYGPGCVTFCVGAIHAYGGADYNYATRITESTFNNLVDWKYN